MDFVIADFETSSEIMTGIMLIINSLHLSHIFFLDAETRDIVHIVGNACWCDFLLLLGSSLMLNLKPDKREKIFTCRY